MPLKVEGKGRPCKFEGSRCHVDAVHIEPCSSFRHKYPAGARASAPDGAPRGPQDVKALKGLVNLVTLKLDQNQLRSLDGLQYKKLTRLATLSASHNVIAELDERMARLQALTSLSLGHNKIAELPCELGELKEKVLLHLNLDDNPIKDSKVRPSRRPSRGAHHRPWLAAYPAHRVLTTALCPTERIQDSVAAGQG
jgi:Leucine-rich repeat (LRR) protein